jgi:hypothetical protein
LTARHTDSRETLLPSLSSPQAKVCGVTLFVVFCCCATSTN